MEVLPGASAAACAYVASGTVCPRFYFGGFFPRKATEQRTVLAELSGLDAALVFYESPNRLVAALSVIAEVLPWREVAVCRELTKLHEEVRRMTLGEASAYYEENPPRGEFVLVVAGAEEKPEAGCTFEAALELVRARMAKGLSTKDAVKQVAKLTGFAKNLLYDAVVK